MELVHTSRPPGCCTPRGPARRRSRVSVPDDWLISSRYRAGSGRIQEHPTEIGSCRLLSLLRRRSHLQLLTINAKRTAISTTPLIGNFCHEVGAEIVALQEVDVNAASSLGFVAAWKARGFNCLLGARDPSSHLHRRLLFLPGELFNPSTSVFWRVLPGFRPVWLMPFAGIALEGSWSFRFMAIREMTV